MVIAVHKKTSHIIYLKYFLLENQVNHGNSENKISDCNKNNHQIENFD